MDDIEQECEDAVFEVCDARERYPALCANQLARCIQLDNEICLAPVKPPTQPKLEKTILTDEQKALFDGLGIESKSKVAASEERAKNWKTLSKKIEDLKIAAEQINKEKNCDINKLLKIKD